MIRQTVLVLLLSVALAKESQIKPEEEHPEPEQQHRIVKSAAPPPQNYEPQTYGAQRITYQKPQPKYLPPTYTPLSQYYQFPHQQIQYRYLASPAQPNYLYQTPQYYYLPTLPTYAAPAVAAAAASKPGIQYVMYLPQNQESQSHNYAGLLQKNAYYNVLPQNYQSPAPRTYAFQIPALKYQSQGYAQQQQVAPQQYVPQQTYTDTRYLVPGITYVGKSQDKAPVDPEHGPQTFGPVPFFTKREPQSLLDSYIPSVLQIQYWKQLQASRGNAITQLDQIQGASEKGLQPPGVEPANYHYSHVN